MNREKRNAHRRWSAITFDIDWNPDWVIENSVRICDELGLAATFFITHVSPAVNKLAETRHERGIHPNFNVGSTHGSNPEDILEHVTTLVPEAVSFRSHGLTNSSPLIVLLRRKHPSIRIESNVFLPFHAELVPTPVYYPGSPEPIIRLPFYFEDDIFCELPGWSWEATMPPSNGLKIFTFHPLLVELNATDLRPYAELRQRLGNRPLVTATREDFDGLRNTTRPGVKDFLVATVQACGPASFATLSDIAAPFLGAVSETRPSA